jgi:hypothetical protein
MGALVTKIYKNRHIAMEPAKLLAAQETPEFHQEGNFPCHSPAVKDTPWLAVSDGTCRAPFLPSVRTRQRF